MIRWLLLLVTGNDHLRIPSMYLSTNYIAPKKKKKENTKCLPSSRERIYFGIGLTHNNNTYKKNIHFVIIVYK